MRASFLVLAPFFVLGCGNKEPAPAPLPSATNSSVAPVPDAPASPLAVVLESKQALAFSSVGDGVVVADEARKVWATAGFGAELGAGPMPSGLPEEGRITRFLGRVPQSIWVIFEQPGEKKAMKNPLLRFERAKGSFKQYADDWKPLIAPWTKKRLLSMSTSSGKLKIKVIEPYQDKPLTDGPSPLLNDENCTKSIKLETMTTLTTGDVFASGVCKSGDTGRRQVIVKWPIASALDKLDAGADDAGAKEEKKDAKKEAKDAVEMVDAGPVPDAGEIADAGATSGDAPAAPVGILGEVFVVPGVSSGMKHLAFVTRELGDAWLLAADATSTALIRFDGATVESQPLPKFQGAARSIAATSDGTLWFVSANSIFKRKTSGEWEEVAPPTRLFPEPDPKWEFFEIGAGGMDVWISAKHASSTASRFVVLRERPAKDIVRWP